MADKEKAVNFWLRDKSVNGTLIARHREEMLVQYQSRFYIVRGKTPDKKHFTQSSLPAQWRKRIAGESLPPLPPEQAQAQVTDKERTPRAKREGEPEKAVLEGKLMAPAEKAPVKQPSTLKRRRAAKPSQEAAKDPVDFLCPYCRTRHSCDATERANRPFFENCSKCGKDFAVKIVTKVIHVAVVAGFRE